MPRLFIICLAVFGLCGTTPAAEPARGLDLSRWKLTLPVDTDLPGRPDEIEQPRLRDYIDQRHFYPTSDGKGLIFRAPCNGVPTKGSSYPRCELREMSADGRREAAWSTSDDRIHELSLQAAITQVPTAKPHLVCAQIHDAQRDVLMVRLEGKKLFVERKPDADVMLDKNYALGAPFDLRIEAGQGRIRLWHNGQLSLDWPTTRHGCYFKAGCYVQSNPAKGDGGEEYGEVVLHRLSLSNP